ncbi:MAG: bifunctional alpha,alpha-trehalose-phosphate synthase (UDP-forming)/trehalose-phosphatase [Bacteroidales bacterium]|nr:bifunctional alpha,alpha-trehalose-phosphate synthase (UDP-forming)/trehalose-phosphatase [Bacteroidales bacterium]
MDKILIISNRLPLQLKIDKDTINVKPSVGGVATGMKSIYKQYESKWIGWPGLDKEQINPDTEKKINDVLEKENCVPVLLTHKDTELFYYGFSNRTIWPLFHYFTQFTEYVNDFWKGYIEVNRKYAEVVFQHIEGISKIWIHDYHLLLLPALIKERYPEVMIGFFLHIPFPSYEIFRGLPWRMEIMKGMLGADLIGFHTYDYERHFISCVRRLLGYETTINQINLENRIVKVDAFPMGIDYDKFHNDAIQQQQRSVKDKLKIRKDIEQYFLTDHERKLVLSIDRLDYSKGIPNRLRAFEYFLYKYPQYREKITLIMLAVPSRDVVEQYQLIKSEVDELVGRINGQYSSINWTPIWYFYRSLPYESLIELYNSCDIALITPIRDGMNLVAKEYIASKTDGKGVLILSEMAGATKELSEAILINPNNKEEIADAIKQAIEMPVEEQKERNAILQKRLQRYNVEKWAQDFMKSLDNVKVIQARSLAKKINEPILADIKKQYNKATNRILFLDYDGTLVGFKKDPSHAVPDEALYKTLDQLSENSRNEIVLISGRDKETFTSWFGEKKYTLIAEHGVWIKRAGEEWQLIEQMQNDWKELIRPGLEFYVDRTPGTFIEEKNYSLVWHYRKADPELGWHRAIELKDELTSLISNYSLEILEGNKVVEIKNSGINKGRAAIKLIAKKHYDFILGIGDDWTDEYLFEELPKSSVTIKVGLVNTHARFNVETFSDVRDLLNTLVKLG